MIDSPCINVCVTEDNVCTACGRTIEEIIQWSDMTEEERTRIMEKLEDSESN